MGLSVLPPFTDSAYWEKQEALRAPGGSGVIDRSSGGGTADQNSMGSAPFVALACWRDMPQVVNALPVLETRSVGAYAGGGLQFFDPQEDYGREKVSYNPVYYVSEANAN